MAKLEIKNRIWIEADGHVLLGRGRVRLLKAIQATHSLSKAAKQEGISYKKAWELIHSVNTTANRPVVMTNTGGKGGGGTRLTEYGSYLIEEYDRINEACQAFLDRELEKLTIKVTI